MERSGYVKGGDPFVVPGEGSRKRLDFQTGKLA